MSARLLRDQVVAHLQTLRDRAQLTELQDIRLEALLGTLADDGRFLLRNALSAGRFTGTDARAQDSFQDFRQKINRAAADAGVDLVLELDSRKEPPDRRYGWFTGGELIDEGIASYTFSAAHTGIVHAVAQSVADLRHTAVYISHATADARAAADLIEEITTNLRLDQTRAWTVTHPGLVALGEIDEAERDRLCAAADVRVALLSAYYLARESAERDRVLNSPGPTLTFALRPLPDIQGGGPLRSWDIHRRNAPWDGLSRRARADYLRELEDALRREVDPRRTKRPSGNTEETLIDFSLTAATRRNPFDSQHAIASAEAAETSMAGSHLARPPQQAGTPAVQRLVDWATDPRGPSLCALLGDVGMGKTTTVKLFTQDLLARRESGPGSPLPVLFDLRDARVSDLLETLSTDSILDSMLTAGRPTSVGTGRLNADVVRRRIGQGNAVVIFDGLDEVLVHLEERDRRRFVRQLWRAVPQESGSRLLLTCRSQYFRTIREETAYFTAEGRDGLRGEDYLALVMLPFREEQVREYLATNLDRPPEWVDGFLKAIAAVHDLTDLSRRPVTLRMIADQVNVIETAKIAGRELRAVELYREFVDRWMARDEEKRVLAPEHKHLLMEEVAAALWRSGRRSWSPEQLDDWLLAVLERRPELERRYRQRLPELLTADFRTATFLARDGDAFHFAHRSLQEYFLACYLNRALAGAEGLAEAWGAEVPSPETLDFLQQLIDGEPEPHRSQRSNRLRLTGWLEPRSG